MHCPSFGVCKTYGAHDARCVCYEDCPSYQDPVCTANGTTYDNKCWHQLSYCRGLENNLVYHPGSCEGEQLRLLICLPSFNLLHVQLYLYFWECQSRCDISNCMQLVKCFKFILSTALLTRLLSCPGQSKTGGPKMV